MKTWTSVLRGWCGVLAAGGAILVAGLAAESMLAQDAVEKAIVKPAPKKGIMEKKAASKLKTKDPFAIPENDEELEKFVNSLTRMQPKDRSEDGLKEHFKKMEESLAKVMDRKISDELAGQVVKIRFQALNLRQQLGDEEAKQAQMDLTKALKKDPRAAVANAANFIDLAMRSQEIPAAELDEIKSVIADAKEFLTSGEISEEKKQVLNMLSVFLLNTTKEEAVELRKDLLSELKDAKQPEALRRAAATADIFGSVQMSMRLEPDERKAVVQEAIALAKDDPAPSADLIQIGMMAIQSIEDSEEKLAGTLYEELAAIAEKSEDKRIQGVAESLRGSARRLALVGSVMQLKGRTIDGGQFDLASLKGKVVLVDFWATWCGPCVAEIPSMKKAYAAYHDKGFEIVGISLDEKEEDLKAFLDEKKLPWINLYDPDQPTGWENPIARHFGINAIPAAILVDQEGKVLTLNARGPELTKRLRKLLGEPAAVAGGDSEEEETEVAEEEEPAKEAAPTKGKKAASKE